MAKKSTKKKEVDEVTITYDLFDLPTAQHKAGLAGLILQIQYMEATKKNYRDGEIPTIEGKADSTSVTIKFTRQSVQTIFVAVHGPRNW